jgi:hypothetical protein
LDKWKWSDASGQHLQYRIPRDHLYRAYTTLREYRLLQPGCLLTLEAQSCVNLNGLDGSGRQLMCEIQLGPVYFTRRT